MNLYTRYYAVNRVVKILYSLHRLVRMLRIFDDIGFLVKQLQRNRCCCRRDNCVKSHFASFTLRVYSETKNIASSGTVILLLEQALASWELGLLENKQFMDVVSPVEWRKICKCIHFPEFESQFNLESGKLHYFSDRYQLLQEQ